MSDSLPSLAHGDRRRVSVAREALLEALGRMARLIPQEETAEAIVTVEEGMLSFAVSGVAASVPAFGTWTGEIRVSAKFVRMVGLDPPDGDPLVIEVRGGRLFVGTTLSAPCVEQDAWRSEVPLSLDATIADVLRLRYLYPRERLVRAGLERRLEEAEAVALEAIGEAAKPPGPFGMSRDELQRVVVRWLEETADRAK